jgi:hypothetical protein
MDVGMDRPSPETASQVQGTGFYGNDPTSRINPRHRLHFGDKVLPSPLPPS